MIVLSRNVSIPDNELEITAIRAQGAGGQHVNKASTAIHLRFDIRASSLPEYYKESLLAASHHLITSDGVMVIKAQEYRKWDIMSILYEWCSTDRAFFVWQVITTAV